MRVPKKTKKAEREPRHFQISVHTLMSAKDCPVRTILKMLNYTGMEPNRSMVAGSAAHLALAEWLRGGDWLEVLEPFREYTAEHGMTEDRRGYTNLVRVLAGVFVRHPLDELPFYIENEKYIEVPFAFPLGEVVVAGETVAVDLIGVIDGIAIDKRSNGLWLLEHKTTGRLDSADVTRYKTYDPQITAYIWATQQITGQTISNCWVNAIQLSMLPTSDRKCPKHGVSYAECNTQPEHLKQTFIECSREPDALARFPKDALLLAKDVIKAAKYAEKYGIDAALKAPCLGPFTGACEYCEFFAWCQTSRRNPEMLDTLLKQREQEDDDYDRLRSGFVHESA